MNSVEATQRSAWYADRLFIAALAAGLAPGLLLLARGEGPRLPPGDILTWPFFSLVLVQPLLEELVFRGLLQGELVRFAWARRSWIGLSVANLLASLAFTAVHFVNHPPLWAAAVFVPSLVFGLFRDRHRRMVSPIVLHITYNLCWFTVAGLGPV